MKTLVTFLAIFLLSLGVVRGGLFTVTNTNDSGTGSLREAINSANTNPGADTIQFNIPQTDPNYNAVTGVWTIAPATVLPYLITDSTFIDGTTQTVNQGNTNPDGPEIMLYGSGSLEYAFSIISSGNTIKGLIISGFTYGIEIYGNYVTQNSIIQNYIGTDEAGSVANANEYGIALSGKTYNNIISNNLISGNNYAGIAVDTSYSTVIIGNIIGLDRTGTASLPNDIGIALNVAKYNLIGGSSYADRNYISGNASGGVIISSGDSNIVKGNFIGTSLDGLSKVANGNGVMVVNSAYNTIGGSLPAERNIISGNTETGIILNGTGTNYNIIKGNYIGVDSTGLGILDNHIGLTLKSASNYNTIGGATDGERNVISGNSEIGVYVESSDWNNFIGNFIGPDATGANPLKLGDTLFQANGMELNTVSSYNTVGGLNTGERNIISGNRVYGFIFYGNCSYNNLIGNYIGTDVTGTYAMSNATGICVDGGSNHNNIEKNLLSGNISYGIFIVTTGTYYNTMKGNLVGTNANGTDTIPNDVGILLGGGTKYNVIGGINPDDRNIISGNHYDGIVIADNTTNYNEIIGNYIGTDINGTQKIPNYMGIVMTTNPKHNRINGNLISGNHRYGIIIYESADSNVFVNNKIGTAVNGTSDIGNGSAGIVIGAGAKYNTIGKPDSGNIIAYNDSSGIILMDNNTDFNRISANSIYSNNYFLLGIEIFPPMTNANDAGDNDTGPNESMNFPVIQTAEYYSANNYTVVKGTLDTHVPELCTVEIFKAQANFFNYGDGKTYLGSASPDTSGNWCDTVTGLVTNDYVTTTATDESGNTSEFSQNKVVTLFSSIEEYSDFVNDFNVYPNPTNGDLRFTIYNLRIKNVEFKIYDLLGNEVIQSVIPSETSNLTINLNNLPAGIYFLKLCIDNEIVKVTKIIINKQAIE